MIARFVASSVAFVFSSFAMRATDFGPRIFPPIDDGFAKSAPRQQPRYPNRASVITGTTPRIPGGLAGLPEPASAAGPRPGRAGPSAAFPHHRKSDTERRSTASPSCRAPSQRRRGPCAAADEGGRARMAADGAGPHRAAAITHHLGRWEREAERCMPGDIYGARGLARARGGRGPGP